MNPRHPEDNTLSLKDWRAILAGDARANRLQFLRNLRDGMSIFDAYNDILPASTAAEATAYFHKLMFKSPKILENYASEEMRRQRRALMTEVAIDAQLSSPNPDERDRGIKHARPTLGLDAPTKQNVTLESPDLDKRKLVPFIPARERFADLEKN